ncbi:MAG: GntR family transcriptional regulator [Anaerolineae bacterium]
MNAKVADTIDRDSYIPAYVQLADILRQQIAAGVFKPGDQLPSEAQLCRRYNVSPMTVRRVINMLVDEGVVVAIQGRGTFVKPIELGTAFFSLQDFQNLFTNQEKSRVKLLETRILSADQRTAQKLAVEPGRRVVFIRRLIFQAGQPVLYHKEYLVYDPYRPLIEAEMEVTSLYGLFSGKGTNLKWGELAIEATVLTEEEAELLKSPAGTAAFRLEHIFYDFEDHPVSWGWFICPSNRLRFRTTVGVRGKERRE